MQKFNVTGMSCAACSARVEKSVSKVNGVIKCSVNLLAGSMIVEGSATDTVIIEAVVKAGYGASVQNENPIVKNSEGESKEKSETSLLARRLLSSVVILLALMYLTMGHLMLGLPLPAMFEANKSLAFILQPILAAAIMFINRKFFISGIKGMINLAPNMDSLVALGSGTSYIYSLYILYRILMLENDSGEHLYFEGAAMVLVLITVGKFLESISKGKTTSAVKSLMKLMPDYAFVLRDGNEIKVMADELIAGDVVVVRAGQQIPADGTVIEGNCSVDESSLTGESLPVEKPSGTQVSASTLCLNGYVKIRAEKTGKETGFAKIINLVMNASSGKAPVQRIADKVSGFFVPVVIGISVVTFIVWFLAGKDLFFSLNRAVSVLVISCPCALGLATPVAIMAGCGVGARKGILFKTSAALENAGRIKAIAFDKTGTLTKGIPEVADILPLDGSAAEEFLLLAAAVEKGSSHPLAQAVLKKAEGRIVPDAVEFENVTGSGVSAIVKGKRIFAGNESFISSVCKGNIPEEKMSELGKEGKTPLVFASEDKIIGIIAVADSLKEDAVSAVKELDAMGIRTAMITGDNEFTASAIASIAGIKTVFAGVKPDQKSEIVSRMKKDWGNVAMTGDGVNDAVALTSADTGIAIGAGTDVAIDSADVVLVNSRVMDAVNAIRLSQSTLRIIHQNLFWAFIYNLMLIPLAAGLWYPLFGWALNPMLASACMSLSSFCVVTNALRLNLFKMKKSVRIKVEKSGKNGNPVKEEKENMEKTFNVEGMMCSRCEAHVREAVGKIAGVAEVVADHNASKVTVKLSADVDDSAIKAAIEGAGYKVN